MIVIKKIIALLLFLFLPVSAHAFDPWSNAQIAMEAGWVAVSIIDLGQSLEDHGQVQRFHPGLSLFGKDCSKDKLVFFSAMSCLIHFGVSAALPSKYRNYWQGATLSVGAGTVMLNARW